MTALPPAPAQHRARVVVAGRLLRAAVRWRARAARATLACGLGLLLAPRAAAQDERAPLVELRPGERIVLLGGAMADRMQHDGWLEALLATRFPELGVSVRNLGFAGDEVGTWWRSDGFGTRDEWLERTGASLIIACYGFNESFAGEEGLQGFRDRLETFITEVRALRLGGASEAPRLLLVSPTPGEDHASGLGPGAAALNAQLSPYLATMQVVAHGRGVPFVDVFTPLASASIGSPRTIDGVHLGEVGNLHLAGLLVTRGFVGLQAPPVDVHAAAALRPLILEQNRLWHDRYRATDGYNVHGGRSALEYDGLSNRAVLQREMEIRDALCARLDRVIVAVARGEDEAAARAAAAEAVPLPEAIPVPTNRPGPGPGGEHAFLSGEEALAQLHPDAGLRVELVADEARFPALVNPVQMAFDARGRLWVAAWPSYPHGAPHEPHRDRLLILPDEDGDGRADRCVEFASDLRNPTGFQFWNGGVVVACAPDLLFLKDTDGDDVADVRERLLGGLDSADTHHTANSLVLGPDGALYWQEGIFHRSQIEGAFGTVRQRDAAAWRYEPRTGRVERWMAYGFLNPHGHVFDRWGQDFVTDGTGNESYYALPASGALPPEQSHERYFTFLAQRGRPAAATEIVTGAHFPPELGGDFLAANVIGLQGIFRDALVEDGSGFAAQERPPLLYGSDPNFRPVDLEIGPDGALYLLDWHNPLIGHMQHHLRDPSRDHAHGRVYRVRAEGRPLAHVTSLAGRPIVELLETLRSHDLRLVGRARIELSGRGRDEVVATARAFEARLDAADPDVEHHRLEALWCQQAQGVLDLTLLDRLLASPEPRARAAAVRVARHMRRELGGAALLERLARAAVDAFPRVRLEAVVALSHFGAGLRGELHALPGDADPATVAREAAEALSILNAARAQPADRFLDYAIRATRRVLEPEALAAEDARIAAARAAEQAAAEHAALAAAQPTGAANADEAAPGPDAPAVQRLLVRPLADLMLFDRAQLVVVAAQPVELTFENTDVMPHNLVVTAPGALSLVGLAAESMAARPDGWARHFVPELPQVLHSTRLLAPGESQTLAFDAPGEPGEHPFVCTFPGHWVRMNGVLHVVATQAEAEALAARIAAAANDGGSGAAPSGGAHAGQPARAAARAFVRHWTPEDFAGPEGLAGLAQADAERGRAIWDAGSCQRCHPVNGQGGRTGPDVVDAVARHPDPRDLLTQLLRPSALIAEGFAAEHFFLKDGRVLSGRVLTETDTSVRLLTDPYGTTLDVIAKDAIDERRVSEVSLMPEGLLGNFTQEEIFDLLAFLEGLRKPAR